MLANSTSSRPISSSRFFIFLRPSSLSARTGSSFFLIDSICDDSLTMGFTRLTEKWEAIIPITTKIARRTREYKMSRLWMNANRR